MRLALLLLLAVPLAGCVAPAGPAPIAAPPGVPSASALHLTTAMGLDAQGDDAPSRYPLRWSWAEWLLAMPPPTWAALPAEQDLLITNASATISLVASLPAVSLQRRPELTAWWGVDGAWVHHAFLEAPDVLPPGGTLTTTIPLNVPVGGLVVPRGGVVLLALASYYADGESVGALDLVLGDPETPTRLDLVAQPIALAPAREEVLLDEAGALVSGRCMDLDAATDADEVRFPLAIPSDAVGLRVVLERTSGTGPPDLDLALLGPDGEVAARAQGPGADEHVTLREANFDAAGRGDWVLRVYNCTPQASEFRVVATVLRA
jgi:hypothetical protein